MFCPSSHLSLVVEVHSINNLLLPILHNFPNSASNHVTSWKRSDGETMPFPCQVIKKEDMKHIGTGDIEIVVIPGLSKSTT